MRGRNGITQCANILALAYKGLTIHDTLYRLEDGTIPFLDILALKHGFQTLSRLAGPMTLVSQHTFSLARYVHGKLSDMKHSNGTPVCVLYCDGDFMDPSKQGGIVNFNLLRPNGDFVGYSEVRHI